MVESSITTHDGVTIDCSIGTPGEVEFNFERIWDFRRRNLKYFKPERLKFYHVHPPGMHELSQKDVNCIEGFQIALGTPIHFCIITFDDADLFNLDCTIVAFESKEDGEIVRTDIESLTHDQLLLLKHLSYGGSNGSPQV